MEPGNLWPYILFLFCVLFGGYFASAESSFAHVNKIKMRALADDGSKRASLVLDIIDDFDKALTTILVGNNIANTCAASIFTVIAINAVKNFQEKGYSVGEKAASAAATAITTVLIFVFGELIPKSFANAKSDKMAMFYAPSVRFFIIIFYPLGFLFSEVSEGLSRLFGVKEEPTVTEDELSDIIDTAEEAGGIDEDESELLQSALKFSRRTVANVLTMRDDIEALDVSTPTDKVLEFIKNSKHTRFPVVSGDLDNVVGVLHTKRFLTEYIKNNNIKLRALISKPYFVTLDREIDGLLEDMSQNKTHMAIAKDENGHTIGLVTIEDFVEELVGEIYDEDEEFNRDFVKLGGNCFDVSAKTDVLRVFDLMRYTPPMPVRKCQIGVWALSLFGHTPEIDESTEYDKLTVICAEKEDGHLARLRLELRTPELEVAEKEGE